MSDKDGGKESGYYYDLGKAWNEVKDDFSHGSKTDKVASTAKLFGKALSNVGVHLMKNAPAYIEKAKTNLEETQNRREGLNSSYEKKKSSELFQIFKDDGVLGASEEERQVALKILKQRKEMQSSNNE
ncbi:MAG: hypothetical protein WBH22_18840 [Pseudomonas mandelii]|uniref:hypothetical protein n=1 Tax=Pseudomonas mandelii TaxID=75612 RepID=UPI003C79050A